MDNKDEKIEKLLQEQINLQKQMLEKREEEAKRREAERRVQHKELLEAIKKSRGFF